MPTFKNINKVVQQDIIDSIKLNNPAYAGDVQDGICFTLTLGWLEYLRANPSVDPYDAWTTYHDLCRDDDSERVKTADHFRSYKTWLAANGSASATAIITQGASIVSASLHVGQTIDNADLSAAQAFVASHVPTAPILLCFKRQNSSGTVTGHTTAIVPYGTDIVYLDVTFGIARLTDTSNDGVKSAIRTGAGNNIIDISCAKIG